MRSASTGEEGLQALRAAPLPDLLVLDVDMPVLGGPGMAHEMLLHDAGEESIPILLMSGREDLPQIAARMGTRYFLRKPADPGRFLEMLDIKRGAMPNHSNNDSERRHHSLVKFEAGRR